MSAQDYLLRGLFKDSNPQQYILRGFFDGVTSGGAKGTSKRRKSAKKLTPEQIQAMDDFGRIQMGMPTKAQELEKSKEILTPEVQEVAILQQIPIRDLSAEITDSLAVIESQVIIDEDIGLILALIEANS